MNLPNGDQKQDSNELRAERDALLLRVADLERQLDQTTRQRDAAQEYLGEYEKMYHYWNEYGIAPPRECEIAEIRENGIDFLQVITEIEAMVGPKAGGASG